MHGEKKEIRFGNRANEYDKGFEGRFLSRFYRMMVEVIDVSPNEALLDVACGTGELLKRLKDIKGISGQGIDVDDRMISVAKEKCPHMDLRVGECDNMPYEDKTFDVITVCMAYHHFENRDGFEREASRLLKKDGKIYIADLRLPVTIRKICNAMFKHMNIVACFYTPEELTENFSKYGFKAERCVKSGVAQVICLKKEIA